MSFKIISSGIFTTIQDQGRYGFNHLGITHSGAMDEYAYLWGQKLLNNKSNALEIMVGLKLQATSSTIISLTGANLNFKINGISQAIWQTHVIKEGDTLSFDKRVSGQRAYLAVKGEFNGDKKYGSYATTLKENIGKNLQRGDILETETLVPNNGGKAFQFRTIQDFIPDYEKPLTLRLLLSYQEDYFTQEEKEKFFNSEYGITLQSNRMGYKLKGQAINPTHGGIISEAIAFGSVQIPKDGQPIILLKERQTIGGYPKIGTVLAVDCFKISQMTVGSKIKFEPIEMEEGERIMRKFYRFFS
ncbi:MAG: biotin-dependent carboxyltransferase family protein [Sulfurovaceae bacterium]|nr:biotin-dependent carboxyltransferase family protein [Sulfurovaceae bacterium]